MRRWAPILCAGIALAAMIGLPARWVKYGECCHEEGKIPGLTCCGRPILDPHQTNLTRHRPCCDPFVFEAAKLDVVAASGVNVPAPEVAGSAVCGSPVAWTSAFPHEILPTIPPTGPPPGGTPIYIFLDCFLI